jgi:flagellar biosynthetic protein FlhB
MAEEHDDSQKTEAPSQQRLAQAREQGQLVASREVGTVLFLGLGAAFCLVLAPAGLARLAATCRTLLAEAHRLHVDREGMASLLPALLSEVGTALVLPGLALLVAPVAAAALQGAVVWTGAPLAPKFERISPLAGAKRLFSARSLVELAKNLIKIAVVGAALWFLLWPERQAVVASADLAAGPLLAYLADLMFRILATTAVLAALVAGADYGYQWFAFMREMRMSREEVREEHKQNEGDPHIRQRLRAIRLERSRRRMMADVPKATVVITNPTHFAVALRYVAGETAAPRVLAKGTDAVALRIRSVAGENGIPVVENPPLARALHAACDVGELIPPAHYQAVAELVSYVLRLGEQRSRG